MTIRNCGEETTIFRKPERIMTVGSIAVNLLHAAGATDRETTVCQPNGTFQQVFDEVERLAELTGTETEAWASVKEMRERVAAVEADSKGAPTRTAAAVYYFGEAFSINGNKNITQAMMGSLGLTNVFANLDEDFIKGNIEEVIDANPEVIILPYGWIDGQESFEEAKQRLVSTPGMAGVRAVADDRIVGMPASHAQNDPGAVDGLEEVAE